MAIGPEYLETLRERAKTSRIYQRHQMTGLTVADLLDDQAHKALYIKLAKEQGDERVLSLAKSVSERRDVKNKGAYFMRLATKEFKSAKPKAKAAAPKNHA